VDPIYLLSLANPVVASLFFLTFYSIWRQQRARTYIFSWALIYLTASVGWGIDFLRVFFGDFWISLAANAVFPFVALFTTRGAYLRYQGSSPDQFLISIYVISVAISSYISLTLGDVVWRGTSISVGMAIMLLAGVIAVLRASGHDHLDRSIALVLGLVAVVLIARPAMSVLIEGSPPQTGATPESFWLVSMKLVALFAWISFAILFLVRIAVDLMGDLAKQSVTDPLSGVLNRRGLFERAKPVLDQASPDFPVAVLICDIDRFKRINDTFGHSVGDVVIQALAKVLREAVGTSGIVGRLGGEEFAVVLPKTDARSALRFAECVRTAFSHEQHQGIPPTQQPTVSIGLAASCGEESLDALLDRADAALYRAKRGGRDRVACSVPSIGHLAVGDAA
jgi:diguanylate cyclase (GGDEF)-like protein